jgi:cell division protein FtsB
VAASYFVYSAVGGALRTHELTQERTSATSEEATLKQKATYLTAVKNYVASDDYVEQEARRQLGYTRPGEVLYVVTSPPVKTDAKTPTGDWWQRLFPR